MIQKKRYLKYCQELSDLFPEDARVRGMLDELEIRIKELPEPQESEADFSAKTARSKNQYPLPDEVDSGSKSVALFSDGACRGNPGPGAWAALGQDSSGEIIFSASGVEVVTTNNRMELEGAISALNHLAEFLQTEDQMRDTSVYLYSDSKYVVDGMMSWVPGWKARGWKKADGKTPENAEFWQRLDAYRNSFKELRFLWVRGHNGHPQNECCDNMVNKALDEAGF